MHMVHLNYRFPRRLATAGVGVLLALGMVLPATAFASPNLPAACSLQCVQNFGNLQIANRLTALTALAGRATNDLNAGYITSAQNGVIQNDVTNNSNGLNQLKSQLDSTTVEQTARADLKLIYTQFRIYAVVLPRDLRLLHVDIEVYVDGKLRGLQSQIQQWINSAPPSEQQQLNALYSDYKAQLTEAEGQIDAAQGQYSVLTPQLFDSDPGQYKSDYQAYVGDAQAAHADLRKAAQDLHQIAVIIKANSSSSGGASATPTTTTTTGA